MEKGNGVIVCVTGGSGYLGSCLVRKLLHKGYTVHATLRNLGEKSKTSLLKSLPSAETRLKLFEADIYNPQEFETAIDGCQYVFHVATPMLHTPYKDTSEAVVAGVKSIAEYCLRSQTVKRLVYTSSVLMAASPLTEDGSCFKEYIKSKTLSEKEILRYNNEKRSEGEMEVVSLACGLVGGETLLSYLPSSLPVVLSQLTSDQIYLRQLRFSQELMGSIPVVHIEDVCDAHIFCIEKSSLKGRFLCAAESRTIEEIAICYQEIYPLCQIQEGFECEPRGGSKCDLWKLRKEGFKFKYRLKEILNDSVQCAKRLGFLQDF
ncbi:hypothetical protein MIMGU_mgv1a025720mg [Erythranthe guttata]|uniref:Dihydroflavonol 4-reductase n=1 Tax=Erythranthe guttata TaxID=4155 RepID=A0A022RJW3_ERYGU|nr:hypothetical protein MIMGU_mgv1a025720mg [Erythranthe guttata]